MNIKQAKELNIVDYLRWRGYEPVKRHGKELFFFSPLRNDSHPSFAVDEAKGVWADYGEAGTRKGNKVKGGAIHQLAAEICGSMSAGLADLAKFSGQRYHNTHPVSATPKANARISEHNHKLLEHPALLRYLNERKIKLLPARIYCREVWYNNNGCRYFAVGLQNVSGGWDLSAPGFKAAIAPKDVTLITNNRKTCLVFEGMMDMLSYMSILGTKEKIEAYDWCCLNSVALVSRAIPYLANYQSVHLYLDNDEGGNRGTEAIQKHIPNATDHRNAYKDNKDINDYLCNQIKTT